MEVSNKKGTKGMGLARVACWGTIICGIIRLMTMTSLIVREKRERQREEESKRERERERKGERERERVRERERERVRERERENRTLIPKTFHKTCQGNSHVREDDKREKAF